MNDFEKVCSDDDCECPVKIKEVKPIMQTIFDSQKLCAKRDGPKIYNYVKPNENKLLGSTFCPRGYR